MNKLFWTLALLAGITLDASAACEKGEVAGNAVKGLTVTLSSLEVSTDGGERTVTTLGTVKNSLPEAYENVVVELRYFDAKNTLVDTETRKLYQLVVPALDEVTFRISGNPAAPTPAYVNQSARVTAADARCTGGKAKSNGLVDLLISWGPMLLLVGVWIYFMKSNKTPSSKIVVLYEQQIAKMEVQNGLLARIAAAAETRTSKE